MDGESAISYKNNWKAYPKNWFASAVHDNGTEGTVGVQKLARQCALETMVLFCEKADKITLPSERPPQHHLRLKNEWRSG